MSYNLLTMKRRHILGDLYSRCDAIETIPVYLDIKSEEPIGFADESLGRYADAFIFHLPDVICKKFSSNGYSVVTDYELAENNGSSKKRYKLNHFILVAPPSALPMLKRRNSID